MATSGERALPHMLGGLIGRSSETAEIVSLLSTARLFTLTGTGGVGKTRLAAQIASESRNAFPHGVRWVDLDTLTDEAFLPNVVAAKCGVAVRGGTAVTDGLVTALRHRNLLLILDNCEHLLPACARLIEELLTSCLDLHILATSREPLGLPGEVIWLVAPLRVPEQDAIASVEDLMAYDAVALFVARAAAALPTFRLTEENAASVVRICRLTEGLPLALELAAARLRVLSAPELADRLDDALGLLTHGSRTAPSRQRTLRATLDWSYRPLDESEQAMFVRLAVFAGSFSLEAAEMVCAENGVAKGDVLDILARLVDKSLVTVLDSRTETRYRLLEPLRQYACERLGETDSEMRARRRHRDWCAALAAQASAELFGPGQGPWLDRLETEHANVRASLGWSLAHGDTVVAGQIAAGIWPFWQVRGYLHEGHRWLEQILAALPEPTPLRAQLLWIAGILVRPDAELGQRHFSESLAIWQTLGDYEGITRALASQAFLAQVLGDHERAASYLEQSLLLARASSDAQTLTNVLDGLALSILNLGDVDRAEILCLEALELCQRTGDLRVAAAATANLGLIWQARGDEQRAAALWEESLSVRRQIGDRGGTAHVLVLLGNLSVRQGAYARATELFEESLSLRRQIVNHDGVPPIFEGLAAVALAQDEPIRAVQLAAAAQALRTALGVPLPSRERTAHDRTLATARGRLDPEGFTRAWNEGLALSPEQAYATAMGAGASRSASGSDSSLTGLSSLRTASSGSSYALTRREIDVLRLLTFGLTYVQIAETLVISPRTVDAHVRSIFNKLNVHSRSAATRVALQDQLI